MKHELLAPAGSLEICRAVIAAGADAVYLGGAKYGARAFAQNFSETEVLEALDFAHLYGRKIFLTVNTLLKNREMGSELYDYLKPFYEHGLDAVIVQDYGVFQFIRDYFPELPVHVSTQMSVANVHGARFLKEQGAARIVTARELSLGEIRRIYDETGVEIESFVHGALCYCYSGQCLMSSLLGGRSGNRGRCAQPCRLAYQVTDAAGKVYHKKEKYPLSPKDLCAVELLPELCRAGIYSFKIEGRMKSLEYAAGVTSVYRKYLDLYEDSPEAFQVEQADLDYLMQLGNRNGFTGGYYEMRNGRSMMTLTESSHSSVSAKEVFRPVKLEKIPLGGSVVLRTGEPMQMSLWLENAKADGEQNVPDQTKVCFAGEEVQTAQSRPLTPDGVRERFSKTGDTPFEIARMELEMGEHCFAPVGQLNALRRNSLRQMEEKLLDPHRRDYLPETFIRREAEFLREQRSAEEKSAEAKPRLNVQVSDREQLEEVLKYPFVDMISLDLSWDDRLFFENMPVSAERFADILEVCRKKITDAGKQAAFCMPQVFRGNSSAFFEQDICRNLLRNFDRIWVRTWDELGFVLDTLKLDPEKAGLDERLYVFSGEGLYGFERLGLVHYTASPELNQKELTHMPNENGEFCIYGTAPMMVSAQCVYKNYDVCSKKKPDEKKLFLTDRYFKQFFIKRNCKDCYNIIYNSQPLYLLHQADAVKRLGFESYRICFVTESADEAGKILREYQKGFAEGKQVQAPEGRDSFTAGHFRRGVD